MKLEILFYPPKRAKRKNRKENREITTKRFKKIQRRARRLKKYLDGRGLPNSVPNSF